MILDVCVCVCILELIPDELKLSSVMHKKGCDESHGILTFAAQFSKSKAK